MSSKNFFTTEQQEQLIAAIRNAEKNTSGEIRVHVDDSCEGDAMKKAVSIFEKLKMHETAERNGVLFYIAVDSRKFSVIGDKGINEKVPEHFWETVKDKTIEHFKKGEYAQGLSEAIAECGIQLKTYFPYGENDKNELSDDISFH